MPTSLRSFVRLAVEMGPDPIYDEVSTYPNPEINHAAEVNQETVSKKNKKGVKPKMKNKSDAVYNEEDRHKYSYIINPLKAQVRDKIPPPPSSSEKNVSNNVLLRNKMVLAPGTYIHYYRL